MRLTRAILLRLGFGVLSLLFISFIVFLASSIAPGDAATVLAGDKASPEAVQRLRHEMGLDRPWPTRYVEFVEKAARFDFGESYFGTRERVSTILSRDLPMTATIASLAIVIAAFLGIFLGTLASVYENRGIDRTVLIFGTLGVTVPNFVLAPILVGIFAIWLDRLPQDWEVTRHGPDYLYLILPVAILAARPAALLTRLTRASMIDTFQQEFIRSAVAKGVPRGRLIFHHALRNAILPVITAIGTSFGFLLTGSFVVERYFRLPGLGREAIEAIQRGDMPVMQACIMVTGFMFIVINLLVDILLPFLDPRIREAQI